MPKSGHVSVLLMQPNPLRMNGALEQSAFTLTLYVLSLCIRPVAHPTWRHSLTLVGSHNARSRAWLGSSDFVPLYVSRALEGTDMLTLE